jgi:hypothetical protein
MLTARAVVSAEVVETRDGLSLHVTGQGSIERVVVGGTTWGSKGNTVCGLRVREYGSQEWRAVLGTAQRAGKSVVVNAAAKELGLRVAATLTPRDDRIDIEGALIDERKVERSAEVSLVLPAQASGAHWWLDIAESVDLEAAPARPATAASTADAAYALWIDAFDMDPQMAYVSVVGPDGTERQLAVLAEPGSTALVNEKWRTFVVRGIRESDFVGGQIKVRVGNFPGDCRLVSVGAIYLMDARVHPADDATASDLMAKSETQVQARSLGGWRCSNVERRRVTKGWMDAPGVVVEDGQWVEFAVARASQSVGFNVGIPRGDMTVTATGAPRLPHLGYPWGTVTAKSGSGYTLAVSPTMPCTYDFACNPEAKTLSLTLSYGLSSHPQREALKNRAPFRLALYRTDHEWGFREAAKRYYALAPDLFRPPTDRHGFWYAAGPAFEYSGVPGMYAFLEAQGAMRPPQGLARDRAAYETWSDRLSAFFPRSAEIGVLVLPYRHFYHESLHGEGGEDGTFPRIPQNYEEAMRMLQTLKLPFGNWYGHHLREVIESSTMRTKDGKYDIEMWQPGTDICAPSGRVIFRTSASPYLYEDQPEVMTNARSEAEFARQVLERVPQCGGIYYDAGAAGGGVDYFPEHLRYAYSPLVPGPGIGRIADKYEFCRWMADILHPKGKILFANGDHTPNYQNAWHILGFDVVGIEHPSSFGNRAFRFLRTMCCHKPVAFLNFMAQDARVQDYVDVLNHIGLYDMWPAPYVQERPGGRGLSLNPNPVDLVAPYGKVLQDMHRAGWEPVTHARCAPSSVQVERYGPRDGKAYFAVYNSAATEAQVTLTVDAKATGLRRITKAAEFCVHAQTLPVAQASDGRGHVQFTLPGQRLAVVQVGEDSVDDPVAMRDYYVAQREARKAAMRKPPQTPERRQNRHEPNP